jgi:hypothetical protein
VVLELELQKLSNWSGLATEKSSTTALCPVTGSNLRQPKKALVEVHIEV